MRSMTLAAFALLVLITGGALSLASFGSAGAAGHEVEVNNFYFCDDADSGGICETAVTTGDTVTWSVAGGAHTVTQCTDAAFTGCPPSGGFNSGTLSTGATFQQTFTQAGTYFYRCDFHPTLMMGKIVVAAAATETPSPTPIVDGQTGSPTPKPTAAGLPGTGGPPGSSNGVTPWAYALLALGAVLLSGSAATYALARRT